MIRHIVLFQFNDNIQAAEINQLEKRLSSLKDKIHGIVNFHGGINCSPEGLNHAFNYGFTMDFVTVADRDNYLPHPAHQEVVADILPMLVDGLNSAFVFDFEIK